MASSDIACSINSSSYIYKYIIYFPHADMRTKLKVYYEIKTVMSTYIIGMISLVLNVVKFESRPVVSHQ